MAAITGARIKRLGRALGRHRGMLLWAMLALVVSSVIYKSMSTAFVELEIRAASPTGISIYWAGQGQNYSENRAHHTRVFPHKHHYKLLIGDLDKIERIRFDPLTRPGSVTIRELSIYQYGYVPVCLRDTSELSRIKPFRQIDSWRAHDARLDVTSATADPQLELVLDGLPVKTDGRLLGFAWRALLFIALCILFIRSLKWVSKDYQFVPYALLAAFTLVFVMATTSRINAHPDEYVHILAARYYIDHSEPPAACDADTLRSYSPYGVSRLNSTEIAYFLTGKFAGALEFVPVNESFRLRYFNVFLFAMLLLMAIRSVSFRMICLPVLASPQVWYIFSYVNSEGIALFVGLIAVHQLVSDDSWLRRVLAGGSGRRHIGRLLGLSALMAILLMVKKNFFVFDLFIALWAALVYYLGTDRRFWIYLRRLAPALLASLVIYGFWIYEHEAANDFHRAESLEQCRDRMAHEGYRADAPPDKLRPTLYWRDRGLPLTALFEHNWGTKVFYSAFGHFGYLELLGPAAYYQITASVLLLFMAYLVYDTMRRGERIQRLTVGLGIAMFFLLVVLTMWMAWTKDFQPQGRYFFPMVPILGLVLARVRRILNPRLVAAFFLILFALSMYYFIFVGLLGISKY